MQSGNQHRWQKWLIAFTAACLLPSSLLAQSPIGSAFLVNPESLGAQDSPDLQLDEAGNLWITWLDSIGVSAQFDRVIARSVSPQGELGPALVWVDTSDIPLTPVQFPLVVPMPEPTGGLVLFYTRSSTDGLDRIYGQRVSPSGELLGERFAASPPAPSSANGNAVSRLPQGGFFLLEDLVPCLICDDSQSSLYGHILAVDGSPRSSYFRVPRSRRAAPLPGVRSLAVDGQGNAVVVWGRVDDPDLRDSSDIRGRRFSSLGEPLGEEFRVNTTTRGSQAGPSVAADENGDFVVVWQTRYSGGLLRSIFGQRFSKAGKKIGPEFRVNEDRLEKDFVPTVAMDRSGNFVVAWQSFSLSQSRCIQIRARLYRRDGKPAGPEFPVASGDGACCEAPKVAFGPNGIFAVVWQVDLGFSLETGTDIDVYAALFSAPP